MTDKRSEAYDKIDRFLRNNLDDTDYAEFSDALEVLFAASPSAPTLEDAYAEGRKDEAEARAWQPIETAPQTGYMLVHEDGAIRALFRYEGKWEPTNYPALVSDLWSQNVLVGQDAARVLSPLGFRLVVRDGCCEEPTHWMPIPEAPTVAQTPEAQGLNGSPGSESTRPDEQDAPGSSIGLGAEGEQ